jgi:hypothetical protein
MSAYFLPLHAGPIAPPIEAGELAWKPHGAARYAAKALVDCVELIKMIVDCY